MKKHFTLLVLLATAVAQNLFAGGPSAPYRFDSTFAHNGYLIDTLTGGANGTYIEYNEILPGSGNQFWVGGVTNGTFLANKFSATGTQLLSKTGLNYPPYDAAGAYTGAISNGKFYLGGQASNGGHYQNMAYNFDGTTYPIFHQTSMPDSFLTEALFGPQYPVGQTNSNCSAVLANGHIVTAISHVVGDSLYITEFNPTPGVTVSVYPKLTANVGTLRIKAVRTIPGTNSYAVLVYNVQGSSTVFIVTNGVATATYSFNGVKYNAMIPVSATQMLLGGDNLAFFNVTNGATTATTATVSGVLQLTREAQTGEIYAFDGGTLYALNANGTFDNNYNPDGFGNNYAYTGVQPDYYLGTSNQNNLFFTDMEMLGNNILISGFALSVDHHTPASQFASFLIKVKGKAGLCDNFSVALDSVYGTTGCDWNAHVSLTGQFPMNAAFSWSSGGGSNNTVTTSPYIPTGLCPETYKVIFTDGHGCTDSISFVTPPPVACTVPQISNQLSAASNFCEWDALQLGPLSVTGATSAYQWYKNGSPISGQTQSSFTVANCTPSNNGTYYMIATNACGADTSNTTTVTVTANYTPSISQAGNTLSAYLFTPGATFQWYFNGTAISGATSSTYEATQSGNYSVDASNGNCTNNSGEVSVVVTGVENISSARLSIYPNPANEFLVINCDEEIETTEVYNVIGEQVIFVKGQITKLNTAPLAQGVYTIQLKTTKGNTAVKKFLKQ